MRDFKLSRRHFVALGAAASASARIGWAGSHQPTNPLLQKAIPGTGEKIPVIGMGTNRWVADGSPEDMQRFRATLERFFDFGGRVIDTAPVYRSSETALGNLIAELDIDDAFFLATKVDRRTAEEASAQLAESARKLKSEQLDLLQIHNLIGAEALLNDMFKWREAGRIRYVGITTSRMGQFAEIERLMTDYPLDFVQLNYSLLEREAEDRLLPLALDKNIAVLVNRPFTRGKLFDRTRSNQLPAWVRELGCTSWAQYALKFVIAHPAVTCVIPGMSKPDHVADNLGAGTGWLPNTDERVRMANEFAGLV
jgi:aryl-alcohol dehydrogenase-like predicted oxidoreductase